MRRISRVCALLTIASGAALAQRTGALLHQTDSTRRVRRPFDVSATPGIAATGDTVFAALVFDPSLASLARSSAWTASVVSSGGTKDARVQVNLCDIAAVLCGTRGAASIMFAGPLNKDDDFTELADLDGLVNSARVQASFTSNSTNVGSYFAFTGTFSQPGFAYRDSLTFASRSVGHTLYAIEGGGGYRWGAVAVQGAIRWEQSYRAHASQNVCSPASFGPAGTETCTTMVLGAPYASDRTVASVSGAWSIGGNGAARLTVSHDLRHGVTGVDLPVWVMTNPAGGLAGGVRFGYRTDLRQMSMALFVSEFKL
jgi:hypothetical protein